MTISPFSLPAFIAFVASKPPNEKYEYMNCKTCAFGQFGIVIPGWEDKALLKGISTPVFKAAMERPHTWSALHNRLLALPQEG